jgi:uncharacterized protein (TIGR03503 family)
MAGRMSRLWLVALLAPVLAKAAEQESRWLSNTFRIDPSISAVTLLIEREDDSTPVVLIRPDGSKYYYQRHPDTISWASTASRDIITLWQPEPGPWQATGRISAERGLSLVSPFRLQLAPLPARLYRQEIIKLDAELSHEGTRLDAAYYLEGLSLTAQLVGRRDADTDPFALAPRVIGVFADDGTGLDAYPGDGRLTAEVLVDALPGPYLFQAQTTNQVLARTHEQELLVYPTPLSLRMTTPNEDGSWQMLLEVDSELQPDSLVVTGTLTNPLEQSIAVSGSGRVIELPPAVQPGNYRWQGRAFATTREGREVQLQLPEQVIRVSPPLAATAPAAPPSFWLSWPVLGGISAAVSALLLVAIWRWRRKARGRKVSGKKAAEG